MRLRLPFRGNRSDRPDRADLPPGAGTRGDDDDIPGTVREAAPYDEEPQDPDALRPDPPPVVEAPRREAGADHG